MIDPKYRIVYEDPAFPDEPAKIVVPSPNWIEEAMTGLLPPVWVHLQLKEDEDAAIAEGRLQSFRHDEEKWLLQFTAPRIGPLTEEQAMEYLLMKDVPRRVWEDYRDGANSTRFKIVTKEQIPSDRTFRNAWRLNE
jgi:hypothetical protein